MENEINSPNTNGYDAKGDVKIQVEDKEKEPKEKETLLASNKAIHHDIDEFDDSVRPVYDSPTVRIKKSRTLNWFEDVAKLQQENNGLFDFIRNAIDYFEKQIPPWIWLIVAIFLFVYSLAMLIVGSINVQDCPIEQNIAIYMIVAGIFTMIKLSLTIYVQMSRLLKKTVPERLNSLVVKVFDGILTLFLVIWFIAGCVWVYGVNNRVNYNEIYKKVARPMFDIYCNKNLYQFAFATLTLTILVFAFLFSAAVGFVLYLKFRTIKNAEKS